MKTKSKLFQARLFCAVALGIGSYFSLSATAADSAATTTSKTSIPWSQLGAKADADYKGDGLAGVDQKVLNDGVIYTVLNVVFPRAQTQSVWWTRI